jgi:carbonic anhydrase
MIPAQEALLRLRQGNARFAADEVEHGPHHYRVPREMLIAGQDPFAIVVGCSDSRVPVEIVYDQGLGELFVIRVAGNVISCTQMASIELAAVNLGVRLAVVLGHTGCGAMNAALAAVQSGLEPEPENLRQLIAKIRPSVERAVELGRGRDSAEISQLAGREHVRHAVESIRAGSSTIQRLVETDGFMVVGAEYSLVTGLVEFF